jgi:hypothetical protein
MNKNFNSFVTHTKLFLGTSNLDISGDIYSGIVSIVDDWVLDQVFTVPYWDELAREDNMKIINYSEVHPNLISYILHHAKLYNMDVNLEQHYIRIIKGRILHIAKYKDDVMYGVQSAYLNGDTSNKYIPAIYENSTIYVKLPFA